MRLLVVIRKNEWQAAITSPVRFWDSVCHERSIAEACDSALRTQAVAVDTAAIGVAGMGFLPQSLRSW
jgi:hypothetical protein